MAVLTAGAPSASASRATGWTAVEVAPARPEQERLLPGEIVVVEDGR